VVCVSGGGGPVRGRRNLIRNSPARDVYRRRPVASTRAVKRNWLRVVMLGTVGTGPKAEKKDLGLASMEFKEGNASSVGHVLAVDGRIQRTSNRSLGRGKVAGPIHRDNSGYVSAAAAPRDLSTDRISPATEEELGPGDPRFAMARAKVGIISADEQLAKATAARERTGPSIVGSAAHSRNFRADASLLRVPESQLRRSD